MKYAYLDTSAWIVRSEGLSTYRAFTKKELLSLDEKDWRFCHSELVVLEALLKPIRMNQKKLIELYNKIFAESILLPSFDSVFNDALLIAQNVNLKALDAIHVAFAKQYDCKLFITTDPDFKSLKSLPLYFIDLSQISKI